ncbi:MAG: LytR/AlgR family response regulator transcription factor [Coprobacillaceae bacterium]
MRIAICEDNHEDCERISRYLQEYLDTNGFIGDIDTFVSGEALIDAFRPGIYDVIFLDIYLDGVTGIETARQLREKDSNFALVFITRSLDHSMDAFSVRACSYITKPLKKEELEIACNQCQHIFIKNARFIEVVSNRRKIKIPLIKIFYIETYGRETVIHTDVGEITTTMTLLLDNLEQTLGKSFLRCHRSYIVNMNHIKQILPEDILMKNGNKVPIRQRNRAQIHKSYGDFLSLRLFEVTI